MNFLYCTFEPLTKAENGGCAILPPGWIHATRNLSSSVLIMGRKGKVYIEEEDTEIEICPDRIALLIAYRQHKGKIKLRSTASYYWLHFNHPHKPIILKDTDVSMLVNNPAIIKQRLANAALIPQQMDLPEPDYIFQIFRKLLNEQENPSYISWKYQLLFQELLIAITEAAISTYKSTSPLTADSSLVNSIISMIADNLTDPDLSVKSIAYNLQYNPDYIGRQFKNIMDIPIGKYILSLRIKLAAKFLQETHETVANIAGKCGFISLRHFLRQFKSEKGMTPSELRYRFQAIHINFE
ncbi:MAG: helix-turn-helix transcriptional regulator [Spirochaetales bacterium]|nr:helix-turn-helix transcriptional regulator [Spirochaetales bacterium]